MKSSRLIIRIVFSIEPSGVGKLSDVMSSVKDMEKDHDVKLNALVTVVNAMKASKQMKAFGEFFNNQIANATTIVLSRTQNAKEEKLELCVKEIQAVNPKAAIITTPWDAITGEQILNVVERAGFADAGDDERIRRTSP